LKQYFVANVDFLIQQVRNIGTTAIDPRYVDLCDRVPSISVDTDRSVNR
jgi:hypothetical protein